MSNKVKTKSGRVLVMPTLQEDAVITKAAMSDGDAKPLTEAQWEAVKPRLSRGRPRAAQPKISISLRFDADVLQGMKSTGPGWQTRINKVMREWVLTHVQVRATASKPLANPKLRQVKAKNSEKTTKRDHDYA